MVYFMVAVQVTEYLVNVIKEIYCIRVSLLTLLMPDKANADYMISITHE